MFSTLGVVVIVVAGVSLLLVRRVNSQRRQRQMEQHSITADELYALFASGQEVLLFDVRQPLDLLAYPEIIPRAQRIPPNELLERPSLIPKEKDTVVTARVQATKPVAQFYVVQCHFISSGSNS